jgi:peptidoglycan/LPS O-acetylase OafA/YrhL
MAETESPRLRSIGDVLDDNRGVGPGFDFLRVALALGIVVWHAPQIANGSGLPNITRFIWFPNYGMLVMFFALSGFLITGSAQRLGLRNFLINRGLRIFPALFLEVTLSAFVLGPIFTSLSWHAYFSRLQTYHYLTNIVGDIQFVLPGVFDKNPGYYVNGSLWTIPYELGCYAIMSIFIIYGMLRKPAVVLAMSAFYMIAGLVLSQFAFDRHSIGGTLIVNIATGDGARLLVSFMLGIAAYLYRHRIIYDVRIFSAAVALCVIVAVIGPAAWLTPTVLNVLLCPPLVYMTAFVGTTRIPRLPVYGRGDYSYGIYLYGMPIQQAIRAGLPFTTTAVLNLLFAVPLITGFAMFSWHVIEKLILKSRKRFSFMARVRDVEGPTESGAVLPEAKYTPVPGLAAL